jgi:hypothetical protein
MALTTVNLVDKEARNIVTPHSNPTAFSDGELEYISQTCNDLAILLQRAGIVWPRHEIQSVLCKHFKLVQ